MWFLLNTTIIFSYLSLFCIEYLSRLCSETFGQRLTFGATFCGSSNLVQNLGLEHRSSTKKSTILWTTSIFFFNILNFFYSFSLTNVSSYYEERKIKLLINVYIKISRHLGGNFLAFQWATFQHFKSTIGKGLVWIQRPGTCRIRSVPSHVTMSIVWTYSDVTRAIGTIQMIMWMEARLN